jgi:hypothetical protein
MGSRVNRDVNTIGARNRGYCLQYLNARAAHRYAMSRQLATQKRG